MSFQEGGFSSTVTAVVTVTSPSIASSTADSRGGGQYTSQSNAPAQATGDAGRNGNNELSNAGSSNAGLSSTAQKIIICTTTIGGTLILAILLYALWRRRRGASYSEIVRFGPRSSTVTISQHPDHSNLTALPIYQHNRFSIRSSRHPSLANMRAAKRHQIVPSPLRTTVETTTLGNHAWGASTQPPTPSMNGRWQTFLEDASPTATVQEPETAHIPLDSTLDVPTMAASLHSHDSYPRISTKIEGLSPLASPTTLRDPQDRWSWTNSQAPSTPRIAPPNTRSSLTSTRARNAISWVRNQGKGSESTADKLNGKSRPLLKNQAIPPVLAAPPKRRSKLGRHGRVGSLSSIFVPNPQILKTQDEEAQRPVTTTNIEMTQKS